jgi:hypothetical protein
MITKTTLRLQTNAPPTKTRPAKNQDRRKDADERVNKNKPTHGNLEFTKHFPSRLHESAAQDADLWGGWSVGGHGSRRSCCRSSSGAQLARSNTEGAKKETHVSSKRKTK